MGARRKVLAMLGTAEPSPPPPTSAAPPSISTGGAGSPRRSRADGGLGDGGIGGFGMVGGSPRLSGSGGWPYDRGAMTEDDKVDRFKFGAGVILDEVRVFKCVCACACVERGGVRGASTSRRRGWF